MHKWNEFPLEIQPSSRRNDDDTQKKFHANLIKIFNFRVHQLKNEYHSGQKSPIKYHIRILEPNMDRVLPAILVKGEDSLNHFQTLCIAYLSNEINLYPHDGVP